jgi:hypothetical protein
MMMMMLSRTSAALRRTTAIRYAFSMAQWEQIPKPWNVPKTKEERKLLKNPLLNPLPNFATSFNDTLYIPGIEGTALFNMYEEFIEAK